MIARRATPADDALLTSICMHPDIRRWTAADGAPSFDPTSYTAHVNSFAVIIEDKLGALGCFLAFAIELYAYTVHTNLLPTCRGKRAVQAAEVALEFAFTATDAQQLWSMVPEPAAHTRTFAHWMGFRNQFTRHDMFKLDGVRHDMLYVRLDIDEWIQRKAMAPKGAQFHEAMSRLGFHGHEEDEVHDSYVGAAWAMTAHHQFDKALHVYNRYARAAGYPPYEVLSADPPRFKVDGLVLGVQNNEFVLEAA